MSYRPKIKIGILGGGQLGRMLIQEAVNIDVEIHVLDSDENAPCRDIAHSFTYGSFNDFEAVLAFGKNMDVITIEIEHVNVDALKKLEAQGKRVFPQPHIIQLIQDKGAQKEFYTQYEIPTSEYQLIGKNEAKHHTHLLPVFQKLRKGGYDGRGVQLLKNKQDIGKAFAEPSLFEKAVDVSKELSIIVLRNAKGEVATFPVVELEFNPVANLVEFLFSPADVSEEVENIAQQLARKIIDELEMVGLLAVEFFLDKQGNLLVNEIAPRPHNSGHQSIEGNYTSQFMQHLRAILNLPLGNTEITKPSVMVNLLGEDGFSGEAKYEGMEEILALKGVNVHLYGKRLTRPFRKMGHVTVVADTLEEAKQIAVKVKKRLRVVC